MQFYTALRGRDLQETQTMLEDVYHTWAVVITMALVYLSFIL